jgi:hypothetical protein
VSDDDPRKQTIEREPALSELICQGGCGTKSLFRAYVVSFTCATCVHKQKNIADTGSADRRRVWNISRHDRRRMQGMSHSRQGR